MEKTEQEESQRRSTNPIVNQLLDQVNGATYGERASRKNFESGSVNPEEQAQNDEHRKSKPTVENGAAAIGEQLLQSGAQDPSMGWAGVIDDDEIVEPDDEMREKLNRLNMIEEIKREKEEARKPSLLKYRARDPPLSYLQRTIGAPLPETLSLVTHGLPRHPMTTSLYKAEESFHDTIEEENLCNDMFTQLMEKNRVEDLKKNHIDAARDEMEYLKAALVEERFEELKCQVENHRDFREIADRARIEALMMLLPPRLVRQALLLQMEPTPTAPLPERPAPKGARSPGSSRSSKRKPKKLSSKSTNESSTAVEDTQETALGEIVSEMATPNLGIESPEPEVELDNETAHNVYANNINMSKSPTRRGKRSPIRRKKNLISPTVSDLHEHNSTRNNQPLQQKTIEILHAPRKSKYKEEKQEVADIFNRETFRPLPPLLVERVKEARKKLIMENSKAQPKENPKKSKKAKKTKSSSKKVEEAFDVKTDEGTLANITLPTSYEITPRNLTHKNAMTKTESLLKKVSERLANASTPGQSRKFRVSKRSPSREVKSSPKKASRKNKGRQKILKTAVADVVEEKPEQADGVIEVVGQPSTSGVREESNVFYEDELYSRPFAHPEEADYEQNMPRMGVEDFLQRPSIRNTVPRQRVQQRNRKAMGR